MARVQGRSGLLPVDESLTGAAGAMRGTGGPAPNFEDVMEGEQPDDSDDGPEGLDVQALLRAEYEDARDFIDSNVAPLREKAAKYYYGEPFGDEEQGRSQIVLTVTRDTVNAIMPSLMRVFVGGENVVEYAPMTEQDVPAAEQATEYVNYLMDVDGNNRFELFYSVFKDALTRKNGFAWWEWNESEEVTEHRYSGLTIEQAQILRLDPEVEVLEENVTAEQDPRAQEAAQNPQLPPDLQAEFAAYLDVTVDMVVRRRRRNGKLRVETMPPEEFLISRNAKGLDDATFVGRRRFVKASDLIAMGVEEDLVELNKGRDVDFGTNSEALIRQLNPDFQSAASADDSQDDVLLVEGWLRYDGDDDGIAELHFIRAIGNDCEIVHDEIEPDVRIASFTPNPEPHTVFGMSVADDTMDLQELQSHVMRNTLDSLASTIFPSMAVVDNAVELDDVMNTEVGRIIRMKAPGMVQPLVEPFQGQQALAIMEYLDEIRAARTGMSKASQGLDPDVLQSTTKAAVTATLSAAQERLELIARCFAEIGMKRLFRGILRTIIRHQDKPRMMRLRGRWISVDPREWNADMDCIVNVALGRGDDAARMAFVMQVSAKQEQLIAMMGPAGPLCDISQLRASYAEMCRLAGYKDASRFFKPVDSQAAEQMAAAQQQKPQTDPAQMLAQVEVEKAKVDMAVANQKAAIDAWKAKQEDDRERDRLESEIRLKAAELSAKYGAQVNMAEIQAQIDRDRNAMEVAANERTAMHRNTMQAQAQAARPQVVGGRDAGAA